MEIIATEQIEKEYKIFIQLEDELVDNGIVICTETELQERFRGLAHKSYEVGVEEPPENLMLTYKIDTKSRNNELIHLTQEEVDSNIKKVNDKILRMQKAERAQKYSEITDPLLFDALEKFAEQYPNIFGEWIAAKAKIKEEENNLH